MKIFRKIYIFQLKIFTFWPKIFTFSPKILYFWPKFLFSIKNSMVDQKLFLTNNFIFWQKFLFVWRSIFVFWPRFLFFDQQFYIVKNFKNCQKKWNLQNRENIIKYNFVDLQPKIKIWKLQLSKIPKNNIKFEALWTYFFIQISRFY